MGFLCCAVSVWEREKRKRFTKKQKAWTMEWKKKRRGNQFWNSGKIALKRKAATKAKLGRGGFEMDQAFVFYVTSAGGEVGLCLQRNWAVKKRPSENTNGGELWTAQWCLFDQDASLGFRWDTRSKNRPSTLTFLVFEEACLLKEKLWVFSCFHTDKNLYF